MDEHAIDSMEEDRLKVAIERAVADRACASYFSLPRLLAQMQPEIRPAVRAACAVYAPFAEGALWHWVHIRDDAHDGSWSVRRIDRCPDCWLIVSCNEGRYQAAIEHLRVTSMQMRQKAPYN